MKNVVIIFAIVWLGLSTAFSKSDDLDKKHIYREMGFLPDSVKTVVTEYNSLVYAYGHHGIIWAVIYEKSDSLYILNGTTRHYQRKENSEFDTIAFLNSNRELINWGLDSLILQSKVMIPQYNTRYSPLYSSLWVINYKERAFFDSLNAVKYEGKNSMEFNRKYHQLSLILWWLSDPEIRSFIPSSGIRKPTKAQENPEAIEQ